MGGLFLFSEIYVRKDVFLDMGAKMKEYSSLHEEVVTEGKTNTQVHLIYLILSLLLLLVSLLQSISR